MIPETSNNSTVFSLLSIKKAKAHTEESPQHSVSAKHTENLILFRYCKQCRETKEKRFQKERRQGARRRKETLGRDDKDASSSM